MNKIELTQEQYDSFNYPIGDDVEELINQKEYYKAYDLLCSKFPKASVERCKKGDPSPIDSGFIPSWIMVLIMCGAEDLKNLTKSRLQWRAEPECHRLGVEEYYIGKKEGRWTV